MVDLNWLDDFVDSILTQSQPFLPGPACQRADLHENLRAMPLFDGLTQEESILALSTLPKGANSLYLTEMDKGLSGSKVLQGRYADARGRLSKPFVLKLGSPDKIQREVAAMRDLVTPFVNGAVPPVYRSGPTTSLLVQEFAGLSSVSRVTSLRNFSRLDDRGPQVVRRLFEERLSAWYASTDRAHREESSYGEVFDWYLSKAPRTSEDILPANWSALSDWVANLTGEPFGDVRGDVETVCALSHTGALTVVHGDLHSQNVVVDETTGECWPIDFGWCHDGGAPLVDYLMLECSLKFLALPMRADLRTLFEVDQQLTEEPFPTTTLGRVPYGAEIRRVLATVSEVRRQALEVAGYSFDDYRRGLFLMTFAHAGHNGLNRPLVIGSLQMLAAGIRSMHPS